MAPEIPPKFARSEFVQLSPIGMCDRMVVAEMVQRGIKRRDAEHFVARSAKVAPSAIENLRRGKIKSTETLGARITRAFEDFLVRQITQLQNELALARATRRDVDFPAAEAAIRAAKEALGRTAQ